MRSEELHIAKTESRFRDVNERIAETAERIGDTEAELVCECADPECGERIAAPLEDYEKTRADGSHFLVAPGHEEQEHERIVKTRPGFRVIQKLKGVGALAHRLNPRRAET
ncbi:MAG: hypothetical protein AABM30_11645 [Actinomycetota bacterium]